jgi:hypothetical protein
MKSSISIALFLFHSSGTSIAAFVPASTKNNGPLHRTRSTQIYNIFDDLKLIFSEEGKKNRAAYDEREKEEMAAAQREIMERRRNPEKMEEYEAQVRERRDILQKEKDVWSFQQKVEGDALDDWKQLREEGKIKVGSDLERDESSRRLGSEGLVDVRTDERLPYIDQGYVDESADVMSNIMGMFGRKKKRE